MRLGRIGRRRIYEVRYDGGGSWAVRRRSRRKVLASCGTKDAAVTRGGAIARRAAGRCFRAQLVVYNLDGTFAFEYTYPDETPHAEG